MTNDVAEARPGGDAAYGASLTPKGKIILDVFAHRASSDVNDGNDDPSPCFLLDVDRDRAEEVGVVARARFRVFAETKHFPVADEPNRTEPNERTNAVYAKFTQDESAEKGGHHE